MRTYGSNPTLTPRIHQNHDTFRTEEWLYDCAQMIQYFRWHRLKVNRRMFEQLKPFIGIRLVEPLSEVKSPGPISLSLETPIERIETEFAQTVGLSTQKGDNHHTVEVRQSIRPLSHHAIGDGASFSL
jgi:hypothetical protein